VENTNDIKQSQYYEGGVRSTAGGVWGKLTGCVR
jgi:hypothetical protein